MAEMRVALTVDVEGDFGTDSLRGVDDMMPVLLDGFDRHGVRAVLFVVGDVAKRRPALLREAASRGHEIGSHTMTHRALGSASLEVKRTELRESKALLEDITGAPCSGFRAPYFDVPADLGPLLEDAGYVWSSSKAPFSPIGGYRDLRATRAVHRLSGSSVVEVPVPSTLGLPIPEGLSYRRLFWPATALATSPPRVFYVHPYELLDEAADFSLSPYMKPFMTLRMGAWARRHLFALIEGWTARGAVFGPPDLGGTP